ncbi:hypothetical protein LWI28_020329 [Acer negundo]|uniref:Uncharacterized protein n=1 Tax=Acer negundo TaxID=4023 RepID=A0AAD5NV50_ACENE|nr:hypothetical protein LWI28_020329 [Acer negundo]
MGEGGAFFRIPGHPRKDFKDRATTTQPDPDLIPYSTLAKPPAKILSPLSASAGLLVRTPARPSTRAPGYQSIRSMIARVAKAQGSSEQSQRKTRKVATPPAWALLIILLQQSYLPRSSLELQRRKLLLSLIPPLMFLRDRDGYFTTCYEVATALPPPFDLQAALNWDQEQIMAKASQLAGQTQDLMPSSEVILVEGEEEDAAGTRVPKVEEDKSGLAAQERKMLQLDLLFQ